MKKPIRKSDELPKELREWSRTRAIRSHVARREGLYARAVASADYRTALAVLAAAKLRGLYFDEPPHPAGGFPHHSCHFRRGRFGSVPESFEIGR